MTTKGKSLVLAQELRAEILSGKLPEGSKFSSIPKFAVERRTSIGTISKVFAILEKEGLVERRNGSGVYVKKRPSRRYAVVFDSKAEFGIFAHKAVFLQCFLAESRVRNFKFTIFDCVDSEEDCLAVRRALQELPYDGVVLASRGFADGIKKYLKNIPVPAVALYSYKGVCRDVGFSVEWVLSAAERLRNAGCARIAMISGEDHPEEWSRPLKRQSDYFHDLCVRDPQTFRKNDFYDSGITPQDGCRSGLRFLDSLPAGVRPGIIVTDSILTQGVISAALLRGLLPMKDVPIASHANKGAALTSFSLPVWTYEADISRQTAAVLRLLEDRGTGERHVALPLVFRELPPGGLDLPFRKTDKNTMEKT